MNTDRHTTLKRAIQFALVYFAFACTVACWGPRHSPRSGPRCGFADPELTTRMGICYLAAEYYVAHREWPLTKAQLQEQMTKILKEDRAPMSAEELQGISGFLDRFTLLDLRKRGEDLMIHYRLRVERKRVDEKLTLSPRPTADEIIQAATAKGGQNAK